MSGKEENDNFVTVVAVGTEQGEVDSENINFESNSPGYVTVLTIGDTENNNKVLKDVTEEVIVYRLPGERLGFGLKFEGGTKANEFVKRLFIQSCAADSPASRVKSSWGKLVEGDEVLEIDSTPVNTLTRIDCVRFLKDSNVAIKLLVRHIYDGYKPRAKCEDEPPQVIGTEEKRTPPPPPPVPPRKIPRKIFKNANPAPPKDNVENPPSNNDTPQKQVPEPVTPAMKTKKLQSPRGSIKSYYSPNVVRRDRRFSDGSLGPPNAEVYVDLFLQESTQSLSESDDTGSTISTVIDRFGSFPTTTTSSFSGSLPSTPTAVQRQLDVSNITIYDDEEPATVNKPLTKCLGLSKEENNNTIINPVEEGSPSCFQDAPLSYGNESTKIIVPDDSEELVIQPEESKQPVKKPPVPPRARDAVKNTENIKETKRNENTDLPRLVDFVPKSSNGLKENFENSTEIMKLFLENERYKTNLLDFETDENDNLDTYSNGIDLYSSKWSLSSQLATIGEVEEEGGSEIGFNRVKTTPVVIVENADSSNESEKIQCQSEALNNMNSKETDGKMATLPSDSRQPPDGHEFPDFIESNESMKHSQSYFEDADKNSHSNPFSSKDYTPLSSLEYPTKPSNLILCHSVSSSNTDLRPRMYDSTEDLKFNGLVSEPPTNLHTRSQSLIDMSALSKQKNSKWNVLMEQRRKGLSKLKGLVIPEASENEVLPAVSIPEIKSQNTTTFVPVQKVANNINAQTFSSVCSDSSAKPSLPPWPVSNNIPKYSPAFKRRSLQVYPTSINRNENSNYISSSELIKYYEKANSKAYKSNEDDLNPPKSLESISSPTRSDCSFDYVNSTKRYIRDTFSKSHISKEDESDNDSAVSSSQSSYNSRFSPPPSPTRSCELNNYKNKSEDDEKNTNRLLKPSSVEAINRKNILASAKCRSGKDLKVGSPVIRRKQEDSQKLDQPEEIVEKTVEESSPKPPETRIVDKVNNAFADVEMISKQIELKEATKTLSKTTEIEKTPTTKTSKYNFPNVKPPPCPVTPKSSPKDSKENKFSPIYSSYSILSRQAKPINVKALKENFENFGSTPPRPQMKVPTYKPQVSTRNVKAEIAKTESKIISNTEIPVKKTEKIEAKPKEVKVEKKAEEKSAVKASLTKTGAKTIKLHLDNAGSSLGITLAGGTDYENKEVTVYRIRYGSVAYHDGRLKRGDKILSINGKSTIDLTHDEAVELVKEQVTDFVIEMEEGKEVEPSTSNLQRRSSSLSVLTDIRSSTAEIPAKKANHVISFVKDGAGLGFSIEGGKDSPLGDVPLIIKKIFTGGAADKNGQLKVGDEILFINDINFSNLSRMEAWTLMKKVADGNVNIHIFR